MRVLYRARPAACGSFVVFEQAAPVRWCCEGMCRHWTNLIGFGVRDCAASTSRDVNLYRDRPQANGGTMLEVVPVAFCPFCGEAIEPCREK